MGTSDEWATYVQGTPWFEKDDGHIIYLHGGKIWRIHHTDSKMCYEHRAKYLIQGALSVGMSTESHHYHENLPEHLAGMARCNRPCLPGQCPDCDGYGATPAGADGQEGACGTCLGTGGSDVPPAQGWIVF